MSEKPSLAIASSLSTEDKNSATITAVQKAVEEIRFGQVVLTVHEGKVVQIDVTKKQRFT